jgi:hypothetical protein
LALLALATLALKTVLEWKIQAERKTLEPTTVEG